MSLKATISWLLIFSISLFMVNCNKSENEINIGAILPLTGSIAQYGEYMRQGLVLALEDAVEKQIVKPGLINLVIEDSQADPRKSVDAFKKLSNVDNIIACIPATSAVTLAIKPMANSRKIVLVNASAISSEIEDKADYVFSVLPNADSEGSFLAEVAKEKLDKNTAGIVYRNDQSGLSFKEGFRKRFIELGGEIPFIEAHNPNSTDFKTIISKINDFSEVQIIFVASWGPEVAAFAKQMKEMGVDKQIITYETFHSPKVLEIAGNAADGVLFCAPLFDGNSKDPKITEFRNKVKNRFKQDEVNYYIAAHYDAMMLILKALAECNYKPELVRQHLSELVEFEGVSGKMKFSNLGSVEMELGLYTVCNGEFIRFDEK